MSNEIATNTQPLEQTEILVKDTPTHSIFKLPNGKFKKVMKYTAFCTVSPQTEEEKKELFDVMNNSDSDKVVPMKEAVGVILNIVEFFTSPYVVFNEETGEDENGVTTSIKSDDGKWYATSSKAVYYSLQAIAKAFGLPTDENYVPTQFTITSTKRTNGNQIDIKVV